MAGPLRPDRAQKAQVADPNNPQFEPLPRWPVPRHLRYPRNPQDEAKDVGAEARLPAQRQQHGRQQRDVDVSGETPFANVVKVEKVTVTMPVTPAAELNPLDRMVSATDTCKRHGLHRVITHNGKSWRCK